MESQFSRTELLLGKESTLKLSKMHICIFGLGGVGGYVVEMLARSGVGVFTIVDNDNFSISNLNRQILATHSNIGCAKVDEAEKRIKDINPNAIVNKIKEFYLPDNNTINFDDFDYVVDAIDTVSAKIDIICKCKEKNIKIISSMGTGRKLNPGMLKICDISKTEVDPLAKVMRYELRKRNINHLKVCYSNEEVIKHEIVKNEGSNKDVPGSSPFVPSTAGILIAAEVVKDLLMNEM